MTDWDREDLIEDDLLVDDEDDPSDDDLEDDLDSVDDAIDGDDDIDDDSDDDENDDELQDADEDEIDFAIALYREDGEPVGVALEPDLANDFEGLIDYLHRVPGDAGAMGMVSLDSDVLVVVRVRGPRHVQVFVSDAYYADTWTIVRDALDFFGPELGTDDLPDEGPVGDLGMFADQGLSEMDLEAMLMDDDISSEDVAERIAVGARFGSVFHKAVDDYWDVEDDEDD
ncbi:MAG: tRNA adenosine deaminase [Propionibacteriaceae bacterium]|nr:tRNA adenosine deaminase [Propionibacteriaceae bacterium]